MSWLTVKNYCFLVSGLLPDVRSKYTDYVSELPVGRTFTGQMKKNEELIGTTIYDVIDEVSLKPLSL
jgi:hypothetical protein